MPRETTGDVIVITSSSSEGGQTAERSAGRALPAAAAAASSGGKNRDGFIKKRMKDMKKIDEQTNAVSGGDSRREGAEGGRRETARRRNEAKGKNATFLSSSAAVASVASAGPRKGFVPDAGGDASGNSGNSKTVDQAKKGKRMEREEANGKASTSVLKEGESKAKKKKNAKAKAAAINSSGAGVVAPPGNEVGRVFPTWISLDNPASNLVTDSKDVTIGDRGGSKKSEWARKNKWGDAEALADVKANAKAGSKGEKKSNAKTKDRNKGQNEKKMKSPVPQAENVDVQEEVGRSYFTCSFPMSRVKRIIMESEDGGVHSNIRTSLEAVFLINKASELFLNLFAQESFAHATQENKRAIFYKHLASTVCDGKRYEFLSDFVPEKVRAEDALKALAEGL